MTKASPFHALIVLGKKRLSILASCMANLSKFHVVFSFSTLIRLNKDAFEGHLCQTVNNIVSQYSTGPQHNMGCKYMLDVLGWTPLSQRRQEVRLILFCKIINGLAQVPFEGVLVEAYKGTKRKHNMKFRQIGHTTSQYGQSFFSKTISAWNGPAFAEAPSLAVFRSNFLNN